MDDGKIPSNILNRVDESDKVSAKSRVENIATRDILATLLHNARWTMLRKIEDKERIDFLSDGIGNRGG